jgi:electron transport complex protein RnfC
MIRKLFDFPGGIHTRQHKKETTSQPVLQARLPKRLILPMQQHIGHPAEPIVKVGDKVFKGQILARPVTEISASVHAPTSGTIVSIAKYPVPHPSGLQDLCIVLEPDGLDQSRRKEQRFLNHEELSVEQLREVIHQAGIVGLGGAGFPSFIKLNPDAKKVETLLLNGAECEPYITCDEMLMREQAPEIVEGLIIMRHALQASHCIIAIENKKRKALDTMRRAVERCGKDFIEVVDVPTVYPAGGEKQLIQVITGKEVPSQGLPLDIGVICHNVGTAYAVCRAVEHGEPLISRYVTIAGSVAKPRNLDVLIGTPVSDLIEQCGGNRQTLSKVIVGGPMMGFAIHDDEVPVVKTTNCILVNSVIADVPLPSRNNHALPCIRCGACADACPMRLLPQQLYWYAKAKDFDKVQEFNLFDCIECGCCDYVCPSHIPLVQYYRYAKTMIWNQEREKTFSDHSRERHEFHKFRLEREKQEREARHKKKRAEISGTTNADEDKKKAAIQAAMERVRKKREQAGVQPKNVDNLTPEQKRMIDEVDSRRANKPDKRKDSVSN